MHDKTMGRCRRALIVVLLGALTLIGVSAAPAAAAPPVIDDVTISPTTFAGGVGQTVTIRARITSQSGGLRFASAFIDPGLSGTSNSGGMTQEPFSDYWSATIEVPPNHSGAPLTYQVSIIAVGLDQETRNQDVGTLDQAVRDDPPFVGAFRVRPVLLSPTGGAVTIHAEVFDDHGLSQIYADVALRDGGTTRVPLTEVSFATYEGTFDAPATSGMQAQRYVATLGAVDTAGHPAAPTDPRRFNVASQAITVAPPQPDVGSVVIGQSGSVDVELTNNTASDTSVVLSMAGGKPFRFAVNNDVSVTIDLSAGETRSVAIEFTPTRSRTLTNRIWVNPEARRQVTFPVTVTGTGVAPPSA